jgi:AcrR family transcriptional regulator
VARKALKKQRNLPRQERAKRTVESILEATAQVLQAKGYEGTNTNLVAEKCGVSIGSLYQYFPNKEALVGKLIETIYEKDRASIEANLYALHEETLEKLVSTIVDTLIESFSNQANLRRVIFYETPRTKQHAKINGIKTYLTELLEAQLKHRKEFQRPNIKLRLFILVNAVESALYAAVIEYGKKLDKKNFSKELTSLVVNFCSGS